MTLPYVNPNSLRQRILALSVGESMFVLNDDYCEGTARHCASDLAFRFNRKYRVSRNREKRGFSVTREA